MTVKRLQKNINWDNHIIGKNYKTDLQFLHFELSQKFKQYNVELISKAYNWCIAAHRNQIRKSGLPYYTHSLEVARIIINEVPLDEISVVAALLHDVCDNSEFSVDDIRVEFGEEIAGIVDGIHQIQVISQYGIKNPENYRKLIISWFNDIRIIIIALADKLHNMRTIEFLNEERQNKLAEEAMDIFVPFANRFGLGSFKWELEDLAYKVLNLEKYNEISRKLQFTREERKLYVKEFIKPLEEALKKNLIFVKNQIKYEILGRAKHIYSIAMKEIIRQKPMEELFDLFAVRIIIDNDNVNYCYTALELVQQTYQLIPGTLKDYIKEPKENGYESIQFAVIGMLSKPVEVQIRTRKMHEYAENGMAAHFRYKPGNVSDDSVLEKQDFEEWIDSIRSIFENHNYDAIKDKTLNTSALKLDDIMVFTHTLESKNMPVNSTALDFAYAIHTEIGNKCIGAKVNNRIVPLDYKLKNGDQVEILNSNSSSPKAFWLEMVKTDRAKYAIKNYLKQQENFYKKTGLDKWINLQKEFSTQLPESEFEILVKKLKFEDKNDFFVSLGNNSIDISYIYDVLLKKLSYEKNIFIDERNIDNDIDEGTANNNTVLKQENITLMECCNPLPGDRIVGEITDTSKINIHRRSCKSISHLINPQKEQIINISWKQINTDKYLSKIKITSVNDRTIIPEITNLINQYDKISIAGINFNTENEIFEGVIKLKIRSIKQYYQLIDELRLRTGINTVDRI